METIQGVRTKLLLVSGSHGAVRVPLAQTFNITPKITERTLNEFDNLEAAAVVTNFDGVDVSFDYLDTDSKLVDAMFADSDPGATVVLDDPSNYQQVTMFANMKGLVTGKIFASVIIKECRAKGSPYSEPVKEEARVTRDLSGTNSIKVKGAAILYTRCLTEGYSGAGTYVQAVPPNAYTDSTLIGYSGYSGVSGTSGYSGAKITLGKTALVYNGASGYDFYVVKNGNDVTGQGGYSMTSTTFELTAQPVAGDVWEVYSLYTDV